MIKKDPEGYRKLLAYKKACELQVLTNEFVLLLPKTKTFFDLADQMSRSGRSGSKNIVEGWKRNTTKEYFDFLGYSIGAVEELKDDTADIATGVYPELLGVKGIMGERGQKGGNVVVKEGKIKREVLDQLPFYPLPPSIPFVVELFLRAKEVNFLLYKLQQSLDQKMDKEFTKPSSQRIRENMQVQKQQDADYEGFLKTQGLKRLENGKIVSSVL